MLMEIKNINLSYGKRDILKDVSFNIPEKKIISITGKSGSGKTTLLGIISGLLKPDNGKVLYQGKDITHWGDFHRSRFRNKEIGFVFQFFNLFSEMTAYENILYPAAINFKAHNPEKEIDELIEYLQIGHIIKQSPSTLSGGERQRVAIARAIINNPKILLADEPTGNLDEATAADIQDLFTRLRDEKGITTIMVTHDSRIVAKSDVHYHLENNQLILVRDKLEKNKKTAATKKGTVKKAATKSVKKTVNKAK